MENNFIPYLMAQLAKAKGFNEPCFAYYGLGLEKDNYSQLQFHLDYGTSFIHIPIENNFFAQTKRNSDLGHAPTAPLYQELINWFEKKEIYVIPDLDISDGTFKWYGEVKIIENYAFKRVFHSKPHPKKLIALNDAFVEAFKLI